MTVRGHKPLLLWCGSTYSQRTPLGQQKRTAGNHLPARIPLVPDVGDEEVAAARLACHRGLLVVGREHDGHVTVDADIDIGELKSVDVVDRDRLHPPLPRPPSWLLAV